MSDPSSRAVTVIPDGPGTQLIGTTISDRYKVEALLGAGGMGSVYLVQHVHMRKRYALKILNSQTAQDPAMVARFEREARAAAHLEHPNITGAVDFGKTSDGAFFLVLEYVEGQRLRDALASGPLEIRRAMHIVRQIASALECSHQLGIIHRDLKPENVMLVTRQGDRDFVKVLDFGLAKVSTVEPGTDLPAQALTKQGIISGTPRYMAPEQCAMGALDGRADLYALGLIFFEMLAGVHPITAKDIYRVIRQQLTVPTPPIKQVAPTVNVPASLEAVVMRLTEKQADKRYESAAKLLDALAEVAEREGIPLPEHTTGSITPPRPAAPTKEPDKAINAASVVEVLSGIQEISSSEPPPKSANNATVTSVDVVSETPLTPAAPAVAPPQSEPAGTRPALAAATVGSLKASESEKAGPPPPRVGRLPAPLQKVPLGLLLGAAVALVGLILFLIFRSGSPSETTPEKSPKQAAPILASQEQLEQAKAIGLPAWLELAKQYPRDARIQRALAQSQISQRKGIEALRYMAQAVAIDARSIPEAEVRQAATLAMNTPESTETAITLLERELGAVGVDVVYALAEQRGQSRAIMRLNASLAKPEVRALAAPAALVAIELRAAEKCEDKYALLRRAAQEGDRRALEQLKPLTLTRNCGTMGLEDCWPCLRKDNLLQTAMTSIEARKNIAK